MRTLISELVESILAGAALQLICYGFLPGEVMEAAILVAQNKEAFQDTNIDPELLYW